MIFANFIWNKENIAMADNQIHFRLNFSCTYYFNITKVNKSLVVNFKRKVYLTTCVGNTTTFILFTKCDYKDNSIVRMVKLIAI
jgi:hypothetical protein